MLLADDLNALGAAAITREERREAFERLQVPPCRHADRGDRHPTRAARWRRADRHRHATARGRRAGRSRADDRRSRPPAFRATSPKRGPIADLFGTFERIARRLAPASLPAGQSSEEVAHEQPSVAAFENYIKGLLAGTPATAISYLTRPCRFSQAFDRARLALWDVYAEQDAHDRALAAVQPVTPGSPWYRRARFLAGLSQLSSKKYDEAFATFKALADVQPDADRSQQSRRRPDAADGHAADRAADVLLHTRPRKPTAASTTTSSISATPTGSNGTRRRRSTGCAKPCGATPPMAMRTSCWGRRSSAAGNAAEANREKELARRLSSTYAEWEKRPAADVVPRGLERVKSGVELPHPAAWRTTLTSGQRDQRELAQFYLDRGRRLYEQESDGDALAELNRALFLSPYLAEAHLLVGRIHLRGGHVREAIEALKISLWSAETAEAHAVLAEAYLDAQGRGRRAQRGRARAGARPGVGRRQAGPRQDPMNEHVRRGSRASASCYNRPRLGSSHAQDDGFTKFS